MKVRSKVQATGSGLRHWAMLAGIVPTAAVTLGQYDLAVLVYKKNGSDHARAATGCNDKNLRHPGVGGSRPRIANRRHLGRGVPSPMPNAARTRVFDYEAASCTAAAGDFATSRRWQPQHDPAARRTDRPADEFTRSVTTGAHLSPGATQSRGRRCASSPDHPTTGSGSADRRSRHLGDDRRARPRGVPPPLTDEPATTTADAAADAPGLRGISTLKEPRPAPRHEPCLPYNFSRWTA